MTGTHRNCDIGAFRVISDPRPIEDGGYRKGAIINREELRNMLRPEYAGFTPGTILANMSGELFKVIQAKHKFELIPA